MRMSKYGEEKADLKLLAIRFVRKLWILLLAVLISGTVFGITYFVKNVVMAPAPTYKTYSMLYVDVVRGEGKDPLYYSFNDGGWAGFVKTDTIIDKAIPHLELSIPKEEIRKSVSASMDSDYRIVELMVTHTDPDIALAIAHAMEQGFVEFAGEMREFEQIRVMTTAESAERIWVTTHTYRAVLWGMILAAAVVLFVMLLREILNDAIDIPEIFEKRYQIPMLGTIYKNGKSDTAEITTNLDYLQKEAYRLAVVGIEPMTPEAEDGLEQALCNDRKAQMKIFPAILQNIEQIDEVRTYDGIILDIPAGKQNGKGIEKVLSLLEKHECKVIAAVLTGADESLLKQYYFKPWIAARAKHADRSRG